MSLCDSVLKFTSTIAKNYPGESVLRSPYRPFGSYMFCSTQGAACIEDREVVLKMLYFIMQSTEENCVDRVAGSCISYHTGYGQMLENITECLFNETNIANPISNSSFEMGIALQMEAIGVGAQNEHALLATRTAGEVKNKQDMNIAELNYKLSNHQSNMAELEWYKLCCKDHGYYDSFKEHNNKKDIHADGCRIKLANFWDEIVKMVENHELPGDFQCQNKWINSGNTYRKLVEPLDIAHHYRHKGDESYLSPGVRPHRHVVLEKWMKDKEQTRIGRSDRTKKPRTKFSSLTEDSCFWAHLEEACKTLASLQQEQQQLLVINSELKGGLEKFEDYVWNRIKVRSISAEVFLEESSFMKWWHQYRQLQLQSPPWQSNSPLFNFMEGESWKLEI
ncbi:hypothetical protein SUGI_0947200 [Cryptomeria japonica]|uniref:lipase-like PAD4 n=1 Tax=Cryptomeria japonica TaxID=3369 RepID=UPI002414A8D7|nr:lipase-like PAD4 [Cryptomeria japonica]GLJ44995.1 hypothetical protein SUGI_0947200 [Cryptomeria japonica]